MMGSAPVITYDFLMGQLRLVLIAVLAFASGKGWLTAQGATLLTVLGTAVGAVAVPWIWSIVTNLSVVNVKSGSAAAAIAKVEVNHPIEAINAAISVVASTGTKITAVILLAFALAAFALPQQALAKFRKPTLDPLNLFQPPPEPSSAIAGFDGLLNKFGAKIQAVEKDVTDKVIADLNAAIQDAINHNDEISLPCWQANLKLAQALPSQWPTPPPLPIGIALSIQIQRDILNAITSDDAGSLKVACAALWGDQILQIGKLGLLFGFAP